MFNQFILSAFLSAAVSSGLAAEVERPSALDGTSYNVVAPVYAGAGGSLSYLRLYNGKTTGNSTFSITVVNADNGFTLGGASIVVPPNASPQYPLTPLGGPSSIMTLAGVQANTSTNYGLYIQNSDTLAGYQHAVFNANTTFFESASTCGTPMNQQLASSTTDRQVVTNVHTTALAGGTGYPSTLILHNYSSASLNVLITGYDSTTGTMVGQTNEIIAANGTSTIAESALEPRLGFSPTSGQVHITLNFAKQGGGTLPLRVSHVVRNATVGGDFNLTNVCAMNAVAPTVVQVPATVPTAYCGSFRPSSSVPFPYYLMTYVFTASVATNGRLRATSIGQYGSTIDGGTASGSVSGTSFTATDDSGYLITGTIQNGQLSGTYRTPYGNISVSASTSNCSS